jgi:hypothetical protein
MPSPDALVRPWRTATIVATLIAAVELVALLVAGFLLLAKPLAHSLQKQAEVRAFAPAKQDAAPRAKAAVPAAPKLTRSQTNVLVLNGNGRSGAASTAAEHIQNVGYSIAATGNAPRTDYASTVVMYRPGYRAEGLRLAQDLHLKVVGPLDGLRPKQLQGAKLAVVLGVG